MENKFIGEEQPIPSITKTNNLPLVIPKPKQPVQSDEVDFYARLGTTKEELAELLEFRENRETRNRFLIFMVGVLLMPVTLLGALVGYARGYNRFMRRKKLMPDFFPMRPIVRIAMIIGAVVAWGFIIVLAVVIFAAGQLEPRNHTLLYQYLLYNTIVSLLIYGGFALWRNGASNAATESNKFGSARFSHKDELFTLKNKTGYYIGDGHLFNDFGHLLTVAGTRGGKGTNIIIPNLLGAGDIETSWVIIDPKGENAAISASYQRSKGQNVVVLNPWGLLADHLGQQHSYNPLDIIDSNSIHFVDDIQVIAEMIVPVDNNAADPFWADSARTIVSGLLLYIMAEKPKEEQTLKTLWELARLSGDDWDELVQDMGSSMHWQHRHLIRNASSEILKLSTSDETFGGIIANVLQATEFLKSPSLQESLISGFDPTTLADGKTTVYVIIPADKLKTHYRWLRLVVTSLMRSVIRKPRNRVTFLLDEFAALGYISEIEVALSTYAGYNLTVWPILQTLVQLENLYNRNWQTFISNCTVRQFFSVNDMFTAHYVSEAIGHTSHVLVKRNWFRIVEAESTQRLLITPDELRRESGKKIFMFIADLHPTYIEKLPYYKISALAERADKNPYIN